MAVIFTDQVIEISFISEFPAINRIERQEQPNENPSANESKLQSLLSKQSPRLQVCINVEIHGQGVNQRVDFEMSGGSVHNSSGDNIPFCQIINHNKDHQANQSISISSTRNVENDGIENPSSS